MSEASLAPARSASDRAGDPATRLVPAAPLQVPREPSRGSSRSAAARSRRRPAAPHPDVVPVGTATDPIQLTFVTDRDPGYRRVGHGKRVRYLDLEGRALRDGETLRRIRVLAIPPAWTDVWICTDPNGHLQAVGRDARGRKQYRYHAVFRRERELEKYGRLLRFARRLPRIRAVVEHDLARPGLPRERVLALVVRLLELTHLRVGNEEYARLNRSFGLSTLRDRHATVRGEQVRFRFRGKSGKEHEVGLRDRRLARLVRRIQELPGQRLFEYLDGDGSHRAIRSEDVNAYLRAAAGAPISAKDFRTWAATVIAFRALRRADEEGSIPPRRRVAMAIEEVAEALGNTPAVSRTSYVHPAVVEAWQEGELDSVRVPGSLPASGPPTPEEEAAVIRLLERRRRVAGQAPRRPRGSGRGDRLARRRSPLADPFPLARAT
jgi:DNA topoisomerase I